ncbi:hypothetical protein [Aneurinibacillus tyrosinisolvens]|uniref:hypothetical protein n=1 Tax=Aneurinibacillus tyrosinisolvens TaxID=1443435 RepID=UPI00063F3796|nr:hypothetical protein [Aneurinibacillus tyrosinisolvens]
MNNEEDNFENVNGSGHIITESGEKLPLTAGRPIKVLHPLLGWVQGTYQYNSKVVILSGEHKSKSGNHIKIQKQKG